MQATTRKEPFFSNILAANYNKLGLKVYNSSVFAKFCTFSNLLQVYYDTLLM
jgi:hypothetical protein